LLKFSLEELSEHIVRESDVSYHSLRLDKKNNSTKKEVPVYGGTRNVRIGAGLRGGVNVVS